MSTDSYTDGYRTALAERLHSWENDRTQVLDGTWLRSHATRLQRMLHDGLGGLVAVVTAIGAGAAAEVLLPNSRENAGVWWMATTPVTLIGLLCVAGAVKRRLVAPLEWDPTDNAEILFREWSRARHAVQALVDGPGHPAHATLVALRAQDRSIEDALVQLSKLYDRRGFEPDLNPEATEARRAEYERLLEELTSTVAAAMAAARTAREAHAARDRYAGVVERVKLDLADARASLVGEMSSLTSDLEVLRDLEQRYRTSPVPA